MTQVNEREYVIPLRRHWFSARTYERTSKAIKAIKQFVAKHMKVLDRNTDKVKLDVSFNNEIWYKGRASPPAKVKVKAVREGDLIKVSFANSEIPAHVKFNEKKQEKYSKETEADANKEEPKKEEEKKTEEQIQNEKEKEKSSAIAKEAEIKQEVKAEKHANKAQKAIHPKRMALKK